MPNTRKNNKKIWKGSGGPYDTETTKSSTGDSSRSSTPSVFSKFLKRINSDTPLNPPTKLKPNSIGLESGENKRGKIDHYYEPNKGQKLNTYPLQTALEENIKKTSGIPKPIAFGPYQDNNEKEAFEDFEDTSSYPITDYHKSLTKRGGKSRRKSKKSKKRTRKTKRKSRR